MVHVKVIYIDMPSNNTIIKAVLGEGANKGNDFFPKGGIMREVAVHVAEFEAMLQASLQRRRILTLMHVLTTVTSGERFIDILARYVEWNRDFKTLVLSLAEEIQLRQDCFGSDGAEAIAHAVIEAAVDEYRGRHGTHASAMLNKAAEFLGVSHERVTLFRAHPSVGRARQELFRCYAYHYDGNIQTLISALGVHAASELLAATEEFPSLDTFFRSSFPDLHAELSRALVEIEGASYPLYSWVENHKELEIAHFGWAIKALNAALREYRGSEDLAVVRAWELEGFTRFVQAQSRFMGALAIPII